MQHADCSEQGVKVVNVFGKGKFDVSGTYETNLN